MSTDSFRSRLSRGGAAVGYSFWTLIASFGIPGVVLYFVLRSLISADIVDTKTLQQPEWIVALFGLQYAVGLAALLVMPKYIQRIPTDKIKELLGIVRRPERNDLWMALGF